MPGAVFIVIAIFIVGPIAVFAGGAIWSALNGWLFSEPVDAEASTAADG